MDRDTDIDEFASASHSRYKRKNARRWTNEERDLFAEVLVDKENNFLVSIERLAAKCSSNNSVLEDVRDVFEEELNKPNFINKNEAANFTDNKGNIISYERLDTSVGKLRSQLKNMKTEWRKYNEGISAKGSVNEPAWYRVVTPILLESRSNLNASMINFEQPVTMSSSEEENQIFIIKDECDLDIENEIAINEKIHDYITNGENSNEHLPIENENESNHTNERVGAESRNETNEHRDPIHIHNSQSDSEINSSTVQASLTLNGRTKRKRSINEFDTSHVESRTINSTTYINSSSHKSYLTSSKRDPNERARRYSSDNVRNGDLEKSYCKYNKHSDINNPSKKQRTTLTSNNKSIPVTPLSDNAACAVSPGNQPEQPKDEQLCADNKIDSKILVEVANSFKSIVQTITEAHTKWIELSIAADERREERERTFRKEQAEKQREHEMKIAQMFTSTNSK